MWRDATTDPMALVLDRPSQPQASTTIDNNTRGCISAQSAEKTRDRIDTWLQDRPAQADVRFRIEPYSFPHVSGPRECWTPIVAWPGLDHALGLNVAGWIAG